MPKEFLTTHLRHFPTHQGQLQPPRLCQAIKFDTNPKAGETD